jgi:dynein heavy chain 2
MQQFIIDAFGGQQVQPSPFALRNIYENESTPKEPIMFIISPGSDPSTELQEFAETVVGRQAFHEMAMGGGTNDAALQLIHNAA